MRKIAIELDDVRSEGELWDDRARRTVAALLPHLPIADRTIHVRWSGAAWRTEKNYALGVGDIENRATRLELGDIIYYDDPRLQLFKIAFVYGLSYWRDAKGDVPVARIGKVTGNVDAFVRASEEVLFRGPKVIAVRLV